MSHSKYIWKEYFWSRSYCLITTDGILIEITKSISKTKEMKFI